jgi:hypothetical protein
MSGVRILLCFLQSLCIFILLWIALRKLEIQIPGLIFALLLRCSLGEHLFSSVEGN